MTNKISIWDVETLYERFIDTWEYQPDDHEIVGITSTDINNLDLVWSIGNKLDCEDEYFLLEASNTHNTTTFKKLSTIFKFMVKCYGLCITKIELTDTSLFVQYNPNFSFFNENYDPSCWTNLEV